LWWLRQREIAARKAGEGFGENTGAVNAAGDELVRERATVAQSFDPAEIFHGKTSTAAPSAFRAALPLLTVIAVNLLMSFLVLPHLDAAFLAEERWGRTSLAAIGGVWAVIVALAAAIAVLVTLNYKYLPSLRESVDAGANASVLPAVSVAS